MKKIMVASLGESLESPVDSHFGRCKYLLVCDLDKQEIVKVIPNDNANSESGAGITTSQAVADEGVESVIAGNLGPKAFEVLEPAGIGIYLFRSGTVKEALEALGTGKLERITSASGPAHAGADRGVK